MKKYIPQELIDENRTEEAAGQLYDIMGQWGLSLIREMGGEASLLRSSEVEEKYRKIFMETYGLEEHAASVMITLCAEACCRILADKALLDKDTLNYYMGVLSNG